MSDTPSAAAEATAEAVSLIPNAEAPAAVLDVTATAARTLDYAAQAANERLSRARATGAYLRELREARGLTQAALASRWGRDAPMLCRIENGRYVLPEAKTLATLADALGLTFAERARLFEVAGRTPI